MPADITGTEIIEENRTTGARERRFLEGPLFSNTILADEINRTPPKTQAALLEAMQERQVTVGRVRHPLSDPFFVLATQNPIEQEGTYPLPEAQQDRFMFKVFVDYPSFDEEFEIARRTTALQVGHDPAGADGRGDPGAAADGARGAGHRPCDSLRAVAGPPDARGASRHARLRPGHGLLGRRPAGRAVPDPGRQGPGAAATAGRTFRPTTSRPWPNRCCGIAWSSISPPKAKASPRTRSSNDWSPSPPPRKTN